MIETNFITIEYVPKVSNLKKLFCVQFVADLYLCININAHCDRYFTNTIHHNFIQHVLCYMV